MPNPKSAARRAVTVLVPVVLTAAVVGCSGPAPAPAAAGPTGSTPRSTTTGAARSPSASATELPAPLFATTGRIVFSIGREGEPARIAYIDAAGVHEIPLPPDPSIQNPVWLTPDSILFDSERDGPRHIYAVRTDGTQLRRLTRPDLWQDTPSVAPDGSSMAYATSDPIRQRDLGVAVSRIDGTSERTVLRTPRSTLQNGNGGPSYSPDGKWLVYMHVTDGARGLCGLWVMRADGTHGRQLTAQSTEAFAPRWSPDGRRILFSAHPDGSPNYTDTQPLWIVDAAGGAPRPLTDPTDSGNAFDGDWSPDGRQIVFRSFGPGMSANELRVVNADGTGMRTLWVAPPGHFAFTPDWAA
jgi:TolB protein